MSGGAVLVVLGGLPGAGKSTLAQALAAQLGATWLRIDLIEQSLRDAGIPPEGIGPAGYAVAQDLAAANLALGRPVVADAVNAVAEARTGWRNAAAEAGARMVPILLTCSDPAEHRRRVERRRADIPGLRLPDWAAVQQRRFLPWPEAALTLDTAQLDPAAALAAVTRLLAG